jgi:beta-glucuronidase
LWFDDDMETALERHDTDDDDDGDDDATVHATTIPAGQVSTASPGVVHLGIVTVPNHRLWSPTNPQLHTITVSINDATVKERFGLRHWDVQDGRIRLNYHIIKLVGWNHHTQWPDTAASPTDQQLDDDIALLRHGNANFVRGAHYPQDPRWLDRLDEAGFVMWSETLGPGVSVANLQDENFLGHQERQLHEMLDAAMNHPSIAFWGFFNEGPSSSTEACPGYQHSSDVIKKRDPTRFITYASNVYPPFDLCYDAATVISHNGYPGWYNRHAHPAEWWNRIANDLKAGMPSNALGKPFVISETGAGGIYEWTDSTTNDTTTLWTIPYQTEIIRQDVENALLNSNISGIALWHFFDFKVDDKWENNTHCDYLPDVEPPTCGYIYVNTTSPSGRPGGANHKGVMDFFRRPKPAYAMVAQRYANITRLSSNLVADTVR